MEEDFKLIGRKYIPVHILFMLFFLLLSVATTLMQHEQNTFFPHLFAYPLSLSLAFLFSLYRFIEPVTLTLNPHRQQVGSLASKAKRDLLMMDFYEMETITFPPDGSSITPAHHYSEFKFKIYAPIAFRYFRDLFGIQPDDFMVSLCETGASNIEKRYK